jgi:hypothetical protein
VQNPDFYFSCFLESLGVSGASPGTAAANRSGTMDEQVVQIGLERLRAHPANSNVMPGGLVEKLMGHIERSGRYPPLVVRRIPELRIEQLGTGNSELGTGEGNESSARGSGPSVPRSAFRVPSCLVPSCTYQVLDGHHRWEALRRLGRDTAACVVWDVDDAEALLLLATLNRLQGRDDPRKRAELLEKLRAEMGGGAGAMAKALPESLEQVRKYLALRGEGPTAPRLESMKVAVHFFLTGEERRELEDALREIGGVREAALMGLVRGRAR